MKNRLYTTYFKGIDVDLFPTNYIDLINNVKFEEYLNKIGYKNSKFQIQTIEKILKNFVNNLSDEDFLDEFTFENKEKFRVIVTFSDEKYIIKVYDKDTCSITPWDGNYSEDIINMSNLPTHFNLYDFCNYVQHKK